MDKYIKPETEILVLDEKDIITTSGEPEDTEDDIDW